MPEVQDLPYHYGNELSGEKAPLTAPVQAPKTYEPEKRDTSLEEVPAPRRGIDMGLISTKVKQDNPWIASQYVNTPVNTKLNETTRYTSATFGYNPLNANIENQYGDRQSWADKLGNTLLKTGVNVIAGFAETIDLIPNAIHAIGTGDMSKMYDNPINNTISSWAESFEESHPNYQTTFEKDHPVLSYVPFIGQATNTWGNVLKNVGFIGGAILASTVQDVLIGALTGGSADAPLIAGEAAIIGTRLGRIFSAGNKGVQELRAAINAGKDVEKVVNQLSTTSKILDKTRYLLGVQTNAWSFGAIMAGTTQKEIEAELKKDYFEKHGFDAQGADLDLINQYAKDGANADLLATSALSTITSAYQLPTILKQFGAAKKSLETTLEGGIKISYNTEKELYERVINPAKGIKGFISKATAAPARLLTSSTLESAKMGGHIFFQRAAEDFYKRKFDDDTISETENLKSSMQEGLKKVFLTREGMEGVIMGGLIGVAMHGIKVGTEKVRGINTNSEALAATQLALLNGNTFKGTFAERYTEAVNSLSIAKDMKKALETDNVFEFKNLQHLALFDSVHSSMKANKFEARIAEMEMAKDLPEAEFKKLFQVEFNKENGETVSAYIDKVISKAHEIKKTIEKVDQAFKNPYDARKDNRYHAFEAYKKQLGIDLSEVKDNRRRINTLSTEISEIHPSINVDGVVNLTSYDGMKQTVKDFEQRIKELDKDLVLSKGDAKAVAKIKKERDFLHDKVEVFTSQMEDFDPSTYMRNTHKIIDYMADPEGAINDKQSLISPIDIPTILNKAEDIYKLGVNSERARDSYNDLVKFKEANKYIKNIVDAIEKQAAKVEVTPEGKIVDTTKPKAPETFTDETDELGNPIAPTPKTPAPTTPAVPALTSQEAADLAILETKAKETTAAPDKENVNSNKGLTPEETQRLEALQAKQKAFEEAPKVDQVAEAAKQGVELSVDANTLSGEIPKFTGQKLSKVEAIKQSIKGIFRAINPQAFFNRVDTRQTNAEEVKNLENSVFRTNPKDLLSKAKITAAPSSSDLKPGQFKLITNTKLYRSGRDINMTLEIDGKVVGNLNPSESLYFDRNGTKVPLREISRDEYEAVTGNDPKSYDIFVKELGLYHDAYQALKAKVGEGATTFESKDIEQFFDIVPVYGSVHFADNSTLATKPKNLKYKGAGDVVLSLPVEYDSQTSTYKRIDNPHIIGEDALTYEAWTRLQWFIVDNIKHLKDLNSRYIYVQQLPDGSYRTMSTFAARPAEANAESIEKLTKTLTSLPDTIKPEDVRTINNQLRTEYYIADAANKGSGTDMYLAVNENGVVSLHIYNKALKLKAQKTFLASELREAQGIEGITDLINRKLTSPDISRLNLKLDKSSFKTHILGDENVTMEELQDKITVSTTPMPYQNYSLQVMPHGSELYRDSAKAVAQTEKERIASGKKPVIFTKEFSPAKVHSAIRAAFGKVFSKPLPDDKVRKLANSQLKFDENGRLDVNFLKATLGIKIASAAKISTDLGVIKGNDSYSRRLARAVHTQESAVMSIIENNPEVPKEIKELAETDPQAAIQQLQATLEKPVQVPKNAPVEGEKASIKLKDGSTFEFTFKDNSWQYQDSKGHWQKASKRDIQNISNPPVEASAPKPEEAKTEEAPVEDTQIPASTTPIDTEEPIVLNMAHTLNMEGTAPIPEPVVPALKASLTAEDLQTIADTAKITSPLKKEPAAPAIDTTTPNAIKFEHTDGFGKVYLLVDPEVKEDYKQGSGEAGGTFKKGADYLKAFAYENRERGDVSIDLRGLTSEQIKEKIKYFKEIVPQEVVEQSTETVDELSIPDKWKTPIIPNSKFFYGWLSEIQKAFQRKAYDQEIIEGRMTEEDLRHIVASTERRETDATKADPINEGGLSQKLVDDVMFRVEHPELIEDVEYWKSKVPEDSKDFPNYLKALSEVIRNGDMLKAIETGVLDPEVAKDILDYTKKQPRAVSILIDNKIKEIEKQKGITFKVNNEARKEVNRAEIAEAPTAEVKPPVFTWDKAQNFPLEVVQEKLKNAKEDLAWERNHGKDAEEIARLESRVSFGEKIVAEKSPKTETEPTLTIEDVKNNPNVPDVIKIMAEKDPEGTLEMLKQQSEGVTADGEKASVQGSTADVTKKEEAPKKTISAKLSGDVKKFLDDYTDGEYGLRDAAEKAKALLNKNEKGISDNFPDLHAQLVAIVDKASNIKAKVTSDEPVTTTAKPIQKGETVTYGGQDFIVKEVEEGKFGRYLEIGDHLVKEEDVTRKLSEAKEAETEEDEYNPFEGLGGYRIIENTPSKITSSVSEEGSRFEIEDTSVRTVVDPVIGELNAEVERNTSNGELLLDEEVERDKQVHERILTDVGLKTVLNRLKGKFGLDYKIIDKDYKEVPMKDSAGKPLKARFFKGKVYINRDLFTKDTPFHEYLHPFVEALKIERNKFNQHAEEFKSLTEERERLAAEEHNQRSEGARLRNERIDIIDDRLNELEDLNVTDESLTSEHLYDKLHRLLAEDPEGMEEISLARRRYSDAEHQDQMDEALVEYLGRAMAENVTKEGAKNKSKFWEAAKRLGTKFKEWLSTIIWGKGTTIAKSSGLSAESAKTSSITPADFGRYGILQGTSVKGAERVDRKGNFTDQTTLQDVVDFLSFSDTRIDLGAYMDTIKTMDKFQKAGTEEEPSLVTKKLNQIRKRVNQLERVDNKRLLSSDLQGEVSRLRGILANENEMESMHNYLRQGSDSLSYVNKDMSLISKTLSEGNLTQDDITTILKRMEVNKSLMAFYDDTRHLLDLFEKDFPKKEAKELRTVAATNTETKARIKGMTTDLLTEWLYPYQERANLNSKTPIDKKAFRSLLYNSDSDVGRLTSLFSSVGSLRDPIAGISRKVLDEIFHKNAINEKALGDDVTRLYRDFLQKHGLSNSRKETQEFYKKNYLRKASVLEKIGEDEQHNPIYSYVDRWAFHEEFLHDQWQKEKDEFIKSLGEEPETYHFGSLTPENLQKKALHDEWAKKIFDWEQANTQEIKTGEVIEKTDAKGNPTGEKHEVVSRIPSEKFRNPEFTKLQSDPFYMRLYKSYQDSNNKVEEGKLEYGIVPQRSKGKSSFSDLSWRNKLSDNAKIIRKGVADKFRGEDDRVETVVGDDGEMRNYAVTDRNVDGTIAQRIVHPYTRMLEESDLDLVLPESILYFDKSSSLFSSLKEAEPNIHALRQIIAGNEKLGIAARTFTKTGNKGIAFYDRLLGTKQYKDGEVSRLNKMLLDFIDNNVYGNTEDKDNVNVLGFNLSLNKLGNNIGFVTALNNMAFNVGAGISNIALGKMLSFIESTGGRYFNKTDWAKAEADYWKEVHLMTNDITSAKKSRNTQNAIYYDAIQGEYRDKYGKNIVGNIAERYANGDSIFFMTHIGEHMIQIQFMNAMMRGQKVQLTNGETTNLFDARVINERGYVELRKDAIWSKEQDNDFRQRLQALNQELNGNYSQFDKAELQRKWYGKMVMIYHKYIYNAWRSRWGERRYDYQFMDEREGSYRNFFKKVATDLKDYKQGGVQRLFSKKGWNEDEKYARNKVMAEASIFAGISMLAIAIGAAKDDDSPKNWGQNTLYLRLLNLKSDIAMNNMFGISKIGQLITNPSANISTVQKLADFFDQLIHDPTERYKKKTGIFSAGESKLKAKALKVVPIARQFYNFLSPKEIVNYYEPPSKSDK